MLVFEKYFRSYYYKSGDGLLSLEKYSNNAFERGQLSPPRTCWVLALPLILEFFARLLQVDDDDDDSD